MLDQILKFLMPWRKPPPKTEVVGAFRERYTHFKELLDSNAELSRILGDIGEKLQGTEVFGQTYVRAQTNRALHHSRRMIECLNVVSGRPNPDLKTALERIEGQLKEIIGEKREAPDVGWVLSFSEITREMVDQVGSKNANLGEIQQGLGFRIPRGFAITTRACEYFLSSNGLPEVIRAKMSEELRDEAAIERVGNELRDEIMTAAVPSDLSLAILGAYDRLVREIQADDPTHTGYIAVRSSAIGEDAETTHAGQYLTVLNVPRERLLEEWKRVVASLFNSWAVSYRLQQGVRDEDLTMSVACLQMVEPVCSGVLFSHHPFSSTENVAEINAVWGLGSMAVDGTITPDLYTLARDPELTLLEARISHKPFKQVCALGGEIETIPVPPDQQHIGCLNLEQMRELLRLGLALEKHCGAPQDIEWAIDGQGRISLLQSRPIRLASKTGRQLTPPSAIESSYPILIQGGVTAFPGVGSGPVVHLGTEDDLKTFPEGAVLVTHHPSPRFVLTMQKAQAIVTDTGSPLGHMASLCREYHVPTLLDVKSATSQLLPGMIVTVDAWSGHIYQGRVEELLDRTHSQASFMRDTPVGQTLDQASRLILPLKLINPRSPEFKPEACASIHDIMRFVHEASYAAMFKISDLLTESEGGAVRLRAKVPLDLYVIDLGGGVVQNPASTKEVQVEEIISSPFAALLKGMLHPDLQLTGPRPIELRGLFSVMGQQMFTPPNSGGERFGDRSYAIISDRYLHFSSRIGYHYSILDAYCDQMVRKNYISFSFQGGAADEVRRSRRARAIMEILKASAFSVRSRADRVDARIRRVELPTLLDNLEMLGKILQFTRQLDMLMHSEESVGQVAKAFLEGRYRLINEA